VLVVHDLVVFEGAGLEDLEDLDLELGELSADEDSTVLLRGLGLSGSLLLLLATTGGSLVEGGSEVLLALLEVGQRRRQVVVDLLAIELDPSVAHESLVELVGHVLGLGDGRNDVLGPHILTEVRHDRVHEGEDGLDVLVDHRGASLVLSSDSVGLLEGDELVELDHHHLELHA
jgi:hypothetical protein